MSFRDRWISFSMSVRNRWIFFSKRKHRRNIRQSRVIWKKLASFSQLGARMLYLRKVSPYVFEEFVLTVFENQGYPIWRSPSYSGDGGMDGKVWIYGMGWVAIQSKRYAKLIKPSHVQAFVNLSKGFSAGIFVHSGSTSDISRDHLLSSNVCILSGSALVGSVDPGHLSVWLQKNLNIKCL